MHQTGTSLLTEVQQSISQQRNPQIQKLSQLKDDIIKKMQHIDVLNGAYQEKSQVVFLNTFKKIMHHLSDQLKTAVEAYQNIDQQIARDQKCLLLSKEKEFFQNQKLSMEEIYQKQLHRLKQVKNKNMQLKRKRNELKSKSILRQQKLSFYQSKNKSLSLQINKCIQLQSEDKKLTESTKYPTSGERTRVITWSSQKKKPLFQNNETQNNMPGSSQFYRTKITKNQNLTPQNSKLRMNSFFL